MPSPAPTQIPAAVPDAEAVLPNVPGQAEMEENAAHTPRVIDFKHSPAYRALFDANLICDKYLVSTATDVSSRPGTWTATGSMLVNALTCNGGCGTSCLLQKTIVNNGNVLRAVHQDGNNFFLGPGIHMLPACYVGTTGDQVKLTSGVIVHGTRAIVTVPQGFIGMATDQGLPLLLPPGMHQWDSPTIVFERLIDLSSNLIAIGPYTLVTVDEGYAAVTQDNGLQKVLAGGKSYMLTHRNWKFIKFLPLKLQQDVLASFRVTSGDNIPLEAIVNVTWNICDADAAARFGASTVGPSSSSDGDLAEFRNDVHRQVRSSLSAFVGSIEFGMAGGYAKMSEKTSGRGSKQYPVPQQVEQGTSEAPGQEEDTGRAALFDKDNLKDAVDHANEICHRYGVRIWSINIISVTPSDAELLDALSKGAVASVAAQQTSIAAKARAQATLISAQADADAMMTIARGEAESDRLRAEGSLMAAQSLEASTVAVSLSRIRAAGTALGEGQANSFFFGLSGAGALPTALLTSRSGHEEV